MIEHGKLEITQQGDDMGVTMTSKDGDREATAFIPFTRTGGHVTDAERLREMNEAELI